PKIDPKPAMPVAAPVAAAAAATALPAALDFDLEAALAQALDATPAVAPAVLPQPAKEVAASLKPAAVTPEIIKPEPAPASGEPDPFSLTSIEAEFARLLGRAPDQDQPTGQTAPLDPPRKA
ncbi:MAG: hypothetical protein ACRCWO_10910, partial [Bosea sp. (in: a-proteobacteria)]